MCSKSSHDILILGHQHGTLWRLQMDPSAFTLPSFVRWLDLSWTVSQKRLAISSGVKWRTKKNQALLSDSLCMLNVSFPAPIGFPYQKPAVFPLGFHLPEGLSLRAGLDSVALSKRLSCIPLRLSRLKGIKTCQISNVSLSTQQVLRRRKIRS